MRTVAFLGAGRLAGRKEGNAVDGMMSVGRQHELLYLLRVLRDRMLLDGVVLDSTRYIRR